MNFKTFCCNWKIKVFCYFNFEKNWDVLKSKSPCILLNKNINFTKNESESKIENPTHSFKGRICCFSAYKNCKLKVKLWWVGAHERKKRAFFVPFYFIRRIFFNICVLSQGIVHWIDFQNIHTFTYQKTLLYTLFYLFLKSLKALSVSLIITLYLSLSHLQIKGGLLTQCAKNIRVIVLWLHFDMI